MIKISTNLFIGDENDCFYDVKPDWAVIHACKSPCHQRAVDYKGNLNNKHPNYLILEKENHLYLNMVDMNMTLLHEFTRPIILTALNFIEKHISSKNILIHCNQGQSRAPALALVFLAKRKNILNNKSYENAKEDFMKIFPQYEPNRGIEVYLNNHWNDI